METRTKSRLISSARLVGDTGLGYLTADTFNRGNYILGTALGIITFALALNDVVELKKGTASLSYLYKRYPTLD